MFHAKSVGRSPGSIPRGYGACSCLRQVDPELIYKLIRDENIKARQGMFCAAPTVLISIANAPEECRKDAPRGVRLFTAGAPPAAATIELVERDLGRRAVVCSADPCLRPH